jgi:hypothetical protein
LVNPPEYEDELKKLKKLPEKWTETDNEINLSFTASREQGTWVAKKIFEKVDKNQLSASINAKHSPNSVDLMINLNVDVAPAVGALSLLLFEIKTRLITDCMRNMNHRRERKNPSLR